MYKFKATKKEVQRLVGKLYFVCKCVRQGRVFLNRVLNFLRTFQGEGQVEVAEEMRRDLLWFERFLPTYNGISLIPPSKYSGVDQHLATDACLDGGGGVCGYEYFGCKQRCV